MTAEPTLTSSVKNGDRQAFSAIYELYADKVYYLSLRFHLDEEEAREVVQDVFLTLWEKRQQLNESFSLQAFLLTIAKHRIINLNKRKAIRVVRTQEYLLYTDTSASATENEVIFSDFEQLTQDFIDSFTPRRKQIFLLRKNEGLTNEEIADRLQVSKRTVENNIYQAAKDIRSFLQRNQMVIRSLLTAIAWACL